MLQHPDAATSVAFSPNGEILATTCADGSIFLWEAGTGRLTTKFMAHQNGAWRVRFLTIDRQLTLVSTGRDGVIRLWDFESRHPIREFSAHQGDRIVLPVAVSPDATKLAYSDTEFTVRTWNLAQDEEGHELVVGQASDIDFSPDGRFLAMVTARHVKVCDVLTGEQVCEFAADSRRVERVMFSPDGRSIVTGSVDRTLKLWAFDERTGVSAERDPRILRGPAGPVGAIAYSPDGSILASAGDDLVVRLWDNATGQQRGALAGHNAAISDLVFSPDGTMMASASDDFTVRIWRAPRETTDSSHK